MILDAVAVAVGGVLGVAGVARVYRGGTTLNDHFVAAQVAGCAAVSPLLWLGAPSRGGPLAIALSLGAIGIYGLFHVLDLRRDPGRLLWLARLSQPAYAFSLWTGLLLSCWAPFALLTGRSVLWPGPLLLGPLFLASWGSAWTALRSGTVRRLSLPGPGLRIVHLSDLHASPCVTARDLRRVVARANALEPDLVAITGDLVMPFSEEDHGFLLDALAGLAAPVVACPGNHDLPISERLGRELAALGIHWLVDDSVVFDVRGATVSVTGVNFHWRDARPRLEAALARLPATTGYRVLLAHDPRLFDWIPEGRFDLVLSGHTHGGQVGGDMFGLQGSVLRLFGAYDQGLFERAGTRLNVHRGNWDVGLPPRMGIASEVVAIDLGQIP